MQVFVCLRLLFSEIKTRFCCILARYRPLLKHVTFYIIKPCFSRSNIEKLCLVQSKYVETYIIGCVHAMEFGDVVISGGAGADTLWEKKKEIDKCLTQTVHKVFYLRRSKNRKIETFTYVKNTN